MRDSIDWPKSNIYHFRSLHLNMTNTRRTTRLTSRVMSITRTLPEMMMTRALVTRRSDRQLTRDRPG